MYFIFMQSQVFETQNNPTSPYDSEFATLSLTAVLFLLLNLRDFLR